ncbi:MAG: T9SS type A sorting domain-containing protein [Saprospiraceae bacterium]|nr:T9SS type A sorting domain-containing protein [Saprospiraceae bacterium]
MKNRFTLFLFLAFCVPFFLTSYSGGRAGGGDEGNTGAPGDVVSGTTKITCQYCHSSGAYGPPTIEIELYDSLGTTKLTTYVPGKLHTVRTTLAAGAGTPLGYGFQMIDINKTTSKPVAGFLPQAAQAANVQIATTSAQSASPNRTYAEHKGVGNSPIFDVKWRAPAKGVGAIVFYASGCAVNKNGQQTGDGSTSVNQEFAEGTTSTKDVADNIRFEVFNDGNTEGVSLLLTSEKAQSVSLRVCNISGQIVLADKWAIASGDNIRSLNLGGVHGAYLIQVIDNQRIITKKIIKF